MDKAEETPTVKETTEVKKTETTPEKEVRTESKTTSEVTPEKKGGSKWWLFCCCGCFALLILCVGVIVGVALLAPTAVQQVLRNSTMLPADSNLTKIDPNTSNETIQQNSTKVQDKLKAAETDLNSKPAGSSVTVHLSPEELLYALADNSSANTSDGSIAQYLQYVSVGMENNLITAQADVGSILNSLRSNPNTSNGLTNSPIDLSLLNGLQVRVELTATTDGKGLKIQSVSTGNALIDSLITTSGSLDSANSEINNAFSGFFEGATVSNIVITHNDLALTLTK
ncbi:MAG: hypothetical protein ACMG57_01325 [Candidatus Dojkabacteria bacterium]